MKKISLFLFLITSILMYIHPAQAQEISDSILLERSLQDKNEGLIDSMLNSWYSQSVNNHHGRLGNDTVKFIYKVYSRFMKDYLHKKMTGKKGIPVNRSYLFIQNKIKYLLIDSISFRDLHYYFGTIFHHYGLLLYEDSINSYINKTIGYSRKNGSLKIISPFYPDLKKIFYDSIYDPKPVYIKEKNRLSTLIHFLGYESLTLGTTVYLTKNIMKLERRSEFLNDVLEFPNEMNRAKFLINFKNPFQPEVLYILVDSKMRYAFVEYLTGTGNVNMAFYPLKLINSDDDRKGIPISWYLLSY